MLSTALVGVRTTIIRNAPSADGLHPPCPEQRNYVTWQLYS
jgi:hypothetical protein